MGDCWYDYGGNSIQIIFIIRCEMGIYISIVLVAILHLILPRILVHRLHCAAPCLFLQCKSASHVDFKAHFQL